MKRTSNRSDTRPKFGNPEIENKDDVSKFEMGQRNRNVKSGTLPISCNTGECECDPESFTHRFDEAKYVVRVRPNVTVHSCKYYLSSGDQKSLTDLRLMLTTYRWTLKKHLKILWFQNNLSLASFLITAICAVFDCRVRINCYSLMTPRRLTFVPWSVRALVSDEVMWYEHGLESCYVRTKDFHVVFLFSLIWPMRQKFFCRSRDSAKGNTYPYYPFECKL